MLLRDLEKIAIGYISEIHGFSGTRNSRLYLELEGKLTSLLLRVDGIESNGHDSIRTARKQVVAMIQNALALLDSSVRTNS